MTREDRYKEQLQALGIYDPAFDPEISTLAQLERELQRAKKEWSATAEPGAKPSFGDSLYSVIASMRKEILAHREALGLTPKSLRKLRGSNGEPTPITRDLLTEKLDEIARRTAAYSGGVEAVPYSGLIDDE